MSEEVAFKLCYPLALAKWHVRSPEFPAENNAFVGYYNQIITHTNYFAVCGAKGCIRACMDNLEKKKMIEQNNFKIPVWPRPPWKLTPPEEDQCGGVAEGKFPDQFNNPDSNPGSWQ